LRNRILHLLGEEPAAGNWRGVILDLVRLSSGSPGLSREQRRDLDAAATRYAEEPEELRLKLSGLLHAWRDAAPVGPASGASSSTNVVHLPGAATEPPINPVMPLMQQAVCQMLDRAIMPVCADRPARVDEVRNLSELAGRARLVDDWREVLAHLGRLAGEIEGDARQSRHSRDRLVALIRLVVANLGDLVDEPAWFRGQSRILGDLLSVPLEDEVIDDAEKVVGQLVAQQAQLRRALDEAKQTFQDLIVKFVDLLGDTGRHVDGYSSRLSGYATQIEGAASIADLGRMVRGLLDDTGSIQSRVKATSNALSEARNEAERAQAEVKRLTAEMDALSTAALHDYLTGALNRRGLDAVLDNEMRRARRAGTPLTVALIDLDHFKKLNDRHGHQGGDLALQYLVATAGRTLREVDRIARYGGEEFAVILPDTTVDAAVAVMTRLQRELTRDVFLLDDNRVLITFSAGVALWTGDESPEDLLKRADAAMYEAKLRGRNQVCRA
jgi:diguanylate cyclase